MIYLNLLKQVSTRALVFSSEAFFPGGGGSFVNFCIWILQTCSKKSYVLESWLKPWFMTQEGTDKKYMDFYVYSGYFK